MKRSILGLLAVLTVCSCGEKKESGTKAPTRVKTEVVNGQSYVGIVEER